MEKITDFSLTSIFIMILLGSTFIIVSEPENNVTARYSWREAYNSNHSASFDREYYIAWQSEKLFPSGFPDNLNIDESKNSYALKLDEQSKYCTLVSYDIKGNKRFEFPLGNDVEYSIPIVTFSDKIIFFINTTFYILDKDGTIEVKKEFNESKGTPNPRLRDEDVIFFIMKENDTVYRYTLDIAGNIIEKVPLSINQTSSLTLFAPKGNNLVLVNHSILLLSKNGSIIWNASFDGNLNAWGVDDDGSVWLFKEKGISYIDENGKNSWNLNFSEIETFYAFTFDGHDNVIVVIYDIYASHSSYGAKIIKLADNGTVLWEIRGPIAHRSPFLDQDGNVVIAGRDWIAELDDDGNIISEIMKYKPYCYTLVTMVDNDTLLMTDSTRIVCMKKFPFEINLKSYRPLIGHTEVKLRLYPWNSDDIPEIKSINVYSSYKMERSKIGTYSGKDRTFEISDPPGNRYEISIEFILDSGEIIKGPSIMIEERDKTILYVGIWLIFTIPPIVILTLGIIFLNRYLKNREDINNQENTPTCSSVKKKE